MLLNVFNNKKLTLSFNGMDLSVAYQTQQDGSYDVTWELVPPENPEPFELASLTNLLAKIDPTGLSSDVGDLFNTIDDHNPLQLTWNSLGIKSIATLSYQSMAFAFKTRKSGTDNTDKETAWSIDFNQLQLNIDALPEFTSNIEWLRLKKRDDHHYQFTGALQASFPLPFLADNNAVLDSFLDIKIKKNQEKQRNTEGNTEEEKTDETGKKLSPNKTLQYKKSIEYCHLISEFKVGSHLFAASLDINKDTTTGKNNKIYTCGWQAENKNNGISINDICQVLGIDTQIPEAINVTLTQVIFTFNDANGTFSLSAKTPNSHLFFVAKKPKDNGKWCFVVGLKYQRDDKGGFDQDTSTLISEFGRKHSGDQFSIVYASEKLENFVLPKFPSIKNTQATLIKPVAEPSQKSSDLWDKTITVEQGLFLTADFNDIALPTIGKFTFDIESFYLKAGLTTASGSKGVKVEVNGVSKITLDDTQVTLAVSALYNGPGEALNLQAYLATQASIGSLVSAFLPDGTRLPEPLSKTSLQQVAISYQTAKVDDNNNVVLDIHCLMSYEQQDTTYTGTFQLRYIRQQDNQTAWMLYISLANEESYRLSNDTNKNSPSSPQISNDNVEQDVNTSAYIELPDIPLLKNIVPELTFRLKDPSVSYIANNTQDTVLLNAVVENTKLAESPAIGLNMNLGLEVYNKTNKESFPIGKLKSLVQNSSGQDGTGQSESPSSGKNNSVVQEGSVSTEPVEKKKSNFPLRFSNMRFNTNNGNVQIATDIQLTSEKLGISVNSVTLTSPLNKILARDFTELTVSVKGVSFYLKTNSFCLSGEILNVGEDQKKGIVRNYAGTLQLQLKKFGMGILVQYVEFKSGNFSLLAFGAVKFSPGIGTPILQITGLAVGFGYNFGFKKVAAKDVPSLPFMQLMNGSGKTELSKLNTSLVPTMGHHLIMVGASIKSSGVFNADLLLLLEIGADKLYLLGRGSLQLASVINIDIGLLGCFDPELGMFIDAEILDNSFILSKDAKVSGSAAFYMWSHGEHAGDMIFSLGGYHPQFMIPAHYPQHLKRLSVNWSISKNTYLKSELYLALTNTALMFGGRMEILSKIEGKYFSAKLAILLQMNAILSSMPFYYYVNFAIKIGLEIRVGFWGISKRFSTSISADLALFGDDSGSGGRGKLTFVNAVKDVTIDFAFGNAKSDVPKISYQKFKANVLGNKLIVARLEGTVLSNKATVQFAEVIILDENALLVVESSAPISDINGEADKLKDAHNEFGIVPVYGKSRLRNSIKLAIEHQNNIEDFFDIDTQSGKFPLGLWGTEPPSKDLQTLNDKSKPSTLTKDNVIQLKTKINRDHAELEYPEVEYSDEKLTDFTLKNHHIEKIKPLEAVQHLDAWDFLNEETA